MSLAKVASIKELRGQNSANPKYRILATSKDGSQAFVWTFSDLENGAPRRADLTLCADDKKPVRMDMVLSSRA